MALSGTFCLRNPVLSYTNGDLVLCRSDWHYRAAACRHSLIWLHYGTPDNICKPGGRTHIHEKTGADEIFICPQLQVACSSGFAVKPDRISIVVLAFRTLRRLAGSCREDILYRFGRTK